MPEIKNFETFEKALEGLNAMMNKLAIGDQEPIIDGPVHPDKYFNSKIKILWILKEAYDTEHNGKGGFEYADHIGQDNIYDSFLKKTPAKKTWYPIVYTSYGILNDFQIYDKMPFLYEGKSVPETLYNIAVVNINKLAGGTTSNPGFIAKVFQKNKELLKNQIEILAPDVVIGGNTLQHFYSLLEFNKFQQGTSEHGTKYYHSNKRIYIDAYHPGHIGLKRPNDYVNEAYIDDIVTIVCEYYNHFRFDTKTVTN